MEYQLVVEYDPETRHYTATVPGLPAIVVDAKTQASAVRLAREAIRFARDESTPIDARRSRPRPRVRAKVVTVNV